MKITVMPFINIIYVLDPIYWIDWLSLENASIELANRLSYL